MATRQEIRDRLRARTTEIECEALEGQTVKLRKLSAFALLEIDEQCGGARPQGKAAGTMMGFVVAQSVIDDEGGFVYESAEQAIGELELPVVQELCDKALDFNGLFQATEPQPIEEEQEPKQTPAKKN